MTYGIVYAATAEKELSKLLENDFLKLRRAINSLSENPFPPGYLKLEGTKEKLFGIRKGYYRVIYSDIETLSRLQF